MTDFFLYLLQFFDIILYFVIMVYLKFVYIMVVDSIFVQENELRM